MIANFVFFISRKDVSETPEVPQEADVLTEEQKKQLEDLQLYRNKEGSVSIQVSFSPPKSSSVLKP